MPKLTIFNHPLIEHKMSLIRDKNTSSKEFRENVSEIGALITYEITRDLPLIDTYVETPICKASCKKVDVDIVIVPILRAGIGMVDGIHNIIPTAKIGHIGLYRDEKTLEAKKYYAKFPKNIENSLVILVDPMLATGNTAIKAVEILKDIKCRNIKYVGLVGCPEGISALQSAHPDIDIYLAALDEKLNENGYIVPGLGDCGDRLFGTK